ncbi:MAG: hypothetical protein IJI53_01860 [Clostridia bacterium]|nr:hypothetical protein [Clostridia bacterium]
MLTSNASDGSTVNITADGDVTATGSKGPNALNLTARYGGAINVTATGTLSAGDGATPIWLNFLDGPEEEQDEKTVKSSVGLTMWAVKPNSDGEIVRAYNAKWEKMTDEETGEEYYRQTGNEYSKEKSQQIEAAINYIVKVAEEFVDKITVGTEKGNTVRVGDKTYNTAQEGENVKVAVSLEDEEELNGIYYNNNNKGSLTSVDSLSKDGESFLMKMLRGGAMLLGLDIHTHDYSDWRYNNDATCTEDGTETAYCSCGKEGPTRTKEGTALGHSFTNYVSDGNATCTQDGTKTAKCDNACGKSDTIVDEGSKLPHTPGDPVRENEVPAQEGIPGSYDMAVYCTVCGEELSRETFEIPAIEVVEPEPEPEPQPEEEPAAPNTRLELQYKPLDADEEFNGLKASEQPEMEEAIAAIGAALNVADTTVSIPAMEEVLTEEQKETFDALPAEEKLVLTLCALGVSENKDSLSKNGADLLETLKESADELLPALAEQFPIEEITIDGEVFESFKIEIVVVKDGVSTFQRYTFFNQNGIWKLFQIENGVYMEVVE